MRRILIALLLAALAIVTRVGTETALAQTGTSTYGHLDE